MSRDVARPSVRVGRYTLQQGGAAYTAAVLVLAMGTLLGAGFLMPGTLAAVAVTLHQLFGPWLLVVLLAGYAPMVVAHEASHVAVLRLAGLPVRIRFGGRLLAVRVEVPVPVLRAVALISAVAPQPVCLGLLAALSWVLPGTWAACCLLGVFEVAGSAGDLLSAAALALSRDTHVLARSS